MLSDFDATQQVNVMPPLKCAGRPKRSRIPSTGRRFIRNAPTKNTTTNKPTAVVPQPELRASKALPRLTLKLQQSVWFDAAASNKEQKDAEK